MRATSRCRESPLPGRFNGAAAHAKVKDGRLTLTSEAKRDNFRDPDGKLYNSAPVLLTEVDNKKPFTLTAKDHTDISEDV